MTTKLDPDSVKDFPVAEKQETKVTVPPNNDDDNPFVEVDLETKLKGYKATFNLDLMTTDWIEQFDQGGGPRCEAISACITQSDIPGGTAVATLRKWPVRKLNVLSLTIIEIMYGPKKRS